MQLLTLGLNHQTAGVALREKVALDAAVMPHALLELTADGPVHEAAILSTCNRTEIYCGRTAEQATLPAESVLQWFADFGGFEARELQQSVYVYPDAAAVKHTFRVACGLDSMVLGEPQILGQMKQAFSTAAALGATGKVLNRLFQHSFSVAKQVRTDTTIGTHPVSVAYAGVHLAKRIFDDLSQQRVLLVGAGETIELVARHLRQHGVQQMMIANRSVDKAATLAQAVGCRALSLRDIPKHLHTADIVVSSTASSLPILGKGAVEAALKRRKHKPMFMLDLAVPRDIEPEVARLGDVYLYTLDDLTDEVAENRHRRQAAAAQAETIIDLQVVRFMRWMRSLAAAPTIKQLRQQLAQLKQHELAKALQKIRHGEDAEKVLQHLAHDLTNKFAHAPSTAINQASMDGDTAFLSAAQRLFKL